MQRAISRRHRTIILAGIVCAVVIILMLLPLAAGREPPGSDGLHYLALGDSIPSGNAFPDDDTRPCQRSPDSYPWILSRQLAAEYEPDAFQFSHIACSGARVAVGEDRVVERCLDELGSDASDSQTDLCALKWLPNQIDEAIDELTGGPALVTITVGANDTGWTDPLGLISLMLATDAEFRASIDRVAEQIELALAAELDRLLDESNVTIIVTDIYNPFNAESILFEFARVAQEAAWGGGDIGEEPCTGVDPDGVEHELSCAERAEYGLQALHGAIASAAGVDSERVTIVSLIEPFRGHESPQGACGDAEPSSGVSWIRDSVGGGLIPFPDCFHPNTAGAEAIAALILDVWSMVDGQ